MSFEDAGAYERFMGRWSRAVAPTFLDWLEPPRRARWLDVGCGTGILSEAIVDFCRPASVVGIDPSTAQIAEVSKGRLASLATFREADAMALPLADASFDVVASALVINFIPDPMRAMHEMRRVATPSGLIAGYVWDFANELSPSGPLRRAMRAFGVDVPAIPGTSDSSLSALETLFKGGGCSDITCRAIEVTLAYPSFSEFWLAQTPSYTPTSKIIAAMTESARKRLMRVVKQSVPTAENGRVEYAARAHAIKGTAVK